MAEHQTDTEVSPAMSPAMSPEINTVRVRELLVALRSEITELLATATGPLSQISARAGDCELQIHWDRTERPAEYRPEPAEYRPAADVNAVANGAAPVAPWSAPPALTTAQTAPETAGYQRLTAPIVGTFYRAPQPGAQPFVEVGHRVTVGQTLAIVEAMKLMNPVKSEWSGTVREVLVADGGSVEFGQLLMIIDESAE